MPSLPDGAPIPDSGPLAGVELVPQVGGFGVYVHVPYCRVRCGYCDFNTYTARELGAGVNQAGYAQQAAAEIRQAARMLAAAQREPGAATTVFFGGGTPTILPAADLASLLGEIRDAFGLDPHAEVTTEANPDTVDERYVEQLAAAGFTRVSLGMQSSVPHVLATLERTHDPVNVQRAVGAARRAGVQVSLDLIYGTPGESLEDWRHSLHSALELSPDHISAYALGIEPGTAMGAAVARGQLQPQDPNELADKYVLADSILGANGYHWYEISNWARRAVNECQHNLAYWRSHDWWGIGPGAHSHVGAVRWWNVKHPRAYAARLGSGNSPAAAREVLTASEREFERIMLHVRLASGLELPPHHEAGVLLAQLVADGLIESEPAAWGVVRLTLAGRLQADAVTRLLTTG